MRARNPVVILIVAALIGVATPAVAQWSVDTVGGPPMAEELGVRNQLAVGVFCQNGSQTVTVILMGQPLQAGTVSARWSDGSSDNYRLRLGRNGHLTGTDQVAQAMIAKLRRLNSVTLRATGPGSVVVEDTISLRGSSQAIGRIGCASSPRRRASATPGQRTAERAAVALGDRMREIEEQRRPEYEAALAWFAAAAAAAERGDGTWATALAAGEGVLALATAMEAEMSAIATEMAALEATAPPEVAALAAPSRMEFEQAVRGVESVVAGLQDQLEVMRTLVAELE